MKPRIQSVLTQWKPGFIASGCVRLRPVASGGRLAASGRRPGVRPIVMINIS